jgi:tetratricopeptide (TPR) repeat protein
MQIRQEQIVFGAVLLLLGLLLALREGEPAARRGGRSGAAPELERFPSPDPRALSVHGVETQLERTLFSPPRDTRPLDPLPFEPPPLPPFLALAPPPVPGPAPHVFARLLQRVPTPLAASGTDPEELLASLDEFGAEGEGEGDAGFDDLSDALAELGYSGDALEPAEPERGLDSALLDAEERRLREQTYLTLYDWVRTGSGLSFGRIENPDPYTLHRRERAGEPIQFREYLAEEGRPRFGGAPAIPLERERVTAFGLADTVSNRLLLAYHDLPPLSSPANVETTLALAEECLAEQLEFDRGLELAETLFARLAAAQPDDPRPGVGLARVHEAAFDFERAFAQYDALTARFPLRVEVLVGLARLEQRFRLFEAAEERLRRAVAVDRGSWLGHFALGEFLLGRGRSAEARSALGEAYARLPQDPARSRERLAVRLGYGAALLAVGEVREAGQVYRDALRADENSEGALAGLVSCALLGDAASDQALPPWIREGGDPAAEGFAALGFEAVLATGLYHWHAGRPLPAVRALRDAADADPLRAAAAHRALSWIAEAAGDPDAALERIDLALEIDPTDLWSHYQRGRLLLARDELDEASAAFRRALLGEADLEDALAGLGVCAWREGRAADAELYFERALLLSEERLAAVEAGAQTAGAGAAARIDLHALRGMNLIEQGEFLRADAAFDRALQGPIPDPVALAGRAWTRYRLGQVEEALIQLRAIDDALRTRPEDDPLRLWARGQIVRVTEHVAKDVWSDAFEYSTVGNGWERHEAAGPEASLRGGELVLSGTFRTSGEARFDRVYAAAEFLSLQARVWISADSNARAGLFVAREQGSGDRARTLAYAAVARSRDGLAQVRAIQPGREDQDWRDLPEAAFPFPAETWVRLGIERVGEGAETTIVITIDGIPVLEGVALSNLARGNNPLTVGLFAEGDTGRRVEIRLDDVEIVRTHGPR